MVWARVLKILFEKQEGDFHKVKMEVDFGDMEQVVEVRLTENEYYQMRAHRFTKVGLDNIIW